MTVKFYINSYACYTLANALMIELYLYCSSCCTHFNSWMKFMKSILLHLFQQSVDSLIWSHDHIRKQNCYSWHLLAKTRNSYSHRMWHLAVVAQFTQHFFQLKQNSPKISLIIRISHAQINVKSQKNYLTDFTVLKHLPFVGVHMKTVLQGFRSLQHY